MFGFFHRTKRFAVTGLTDGMTDIHSHLLPGVDDGAKDLNDSLRILKYLEEIGVRQMFFTPHVMSDLTNNNAGYLSEQFRLFQSNVPENIEVRLAAEYMLDAAFLSHLSDGLLSFDGRHVLVETSYMWAPPNLYELLYEMTVNDYTPVIAHPERYIFMENEDYRTLKRRGCKFQLNLLSLSGYYGKRAKLCSEELLKNDMYDFVGSDIHNMRHEQAYNSFLLTKDTELALRCLLDKNKELWK